MEGAKTPGVDQQHRQWQQHRPPPPPPPQGNLIELQMAYQDAWRVCHPDFKRPFTSLQDACERLLPYHVVSDYEAEEDDKLLESDTTGKMLSRSQQWNRNAEDKAAEFTTTFEKHASTFNEITRKRGTGEYRSEERLMIEQALLQEEKRALLDLKNGIQSRERDALVRMAAMQAEQARRGPMIRCSARGLQCSDIPLNHGLEEQDKNPEEMMNGWANDAQRDEKETYEDFLNDEETENRDTYSWAR